jgi:hypothetical protein
LSGTNFYSYVGQNVTGYVDPFGLERDQRLLVSCVLDASCCFGPLVELPGASGVAAGVSSGYRVYAETAYGIAGGEAGYKRALVMRREILSL